MPDTTETIVIKWVADAKDILTKYEVLKKATAEIKAQMQEMAQKTGASLRELTKIMTDAFQKQVNKQFPLGGDEAKKAMDTYKIAVVSAAEQIKAEQKSEAEAVKQAQQQERDARTQTAKNTEANVKQQATAMRFLAKESKQTSQEMSSGGGGGAGGILGSLFGGGTLSQILGIAGGIALLTTSMRKFAQATQEAVVSGYEFIKGMYAMEVGIRALQRAGVDMTIADAYKQIENLRKSFGIFTTKELVVGSAAFYNLNRDMGFTKEQLFSLQNAIATLAVVNGRSMDEVQKTVALALSSGYTEGLQRLGVSINRVTIAAEAASLGWKGGYTSLTEQQRALATYNLVIRKTAIYQADLLGYQKSIPGQIDTANKSIEEQKNIMGTYLQGLNLAWTKIKQGLYFVFVFNGLIGGLARDVKVVTYLFTHLGEIIEHVWARISEFLPEGSFKNAGKFIEPVIHSYEEMKKLLGEILDIIVEIGNAIGRFVFGKEWEFFKGILQDLKDIGRGKNLQEEMAGGNVPGAKIASKIDKETLAAAQGAVEDSLTEIEAIQKDFEQQSEADLLDHQRRVEDMWINHQRKLEELKLDHERRMDELEIEHQRREKELEVDYLNTMKDIQIGVFRKMGEARREYQQNVKDAWRDYYNRLSEAESKYRNRQIDAERDYQEKLRKLREGFIFDLEDAVRERDARQVLQLIRRYNLEKTQTDREYKEQKDKLAREYKEELSSLARQRDEKLRMLAEELQRRYATIQEEAERERIKAQEDYKAKKADEETRYQDARTAEEVAYGQRKEDEKRRYIQDRQDEETQYKQKQIDLQSEIDRRLKQVADGYVKEVGYTNQAMMAIRQSLLQTLGPGGFAEQIYTYYVGMATAAMQAAALLGKMLQDPNKANYKGTSKPPKTKAKGGIEFASTATDVTYGEAGPEMAMFVPLSKGINSLGNLALSGVGGNGGGQMSGKALIEVILSKDLEGRIVDTTMNNVADVVLRRIRK